MSPLRRAVRIFSIRSRKKKAAYIRDWMDRHDIRTVLMVGALPSKPGSNVGIVEDTVMEGREVKMGIGLRPQPRSVYPYMIADARDMPFEDGYVDFALANAVIEHVGDESDQRRMVAEHCRVARCWAITTPNRWFPVESHTAVAFLHWSPAWRRKRKEFSRLLSLREFRDLLPPEAEVKGSWWSPTFTATYSR
jgi:methyltransferase family protein